jgi:cytochrome oxidase assembly protein ShyY1
MLVSPYALHYQLLNLIAVCPIFLKTNYNFLESKLQHILHWCSLACAVLALVITNTKYVVAFKYHIQIILLCKFERQFY